MTDSSATSQFWCSDRTRIVGCVTLALTHPTVVYSGLEHTDISASAIASQHLPNYANYLLNIL
ncbi:MAG: hypothetical protein V7L27_18800 [Nostoc sp.]|uniref:hypothetical protein n=1 Tax=Nostoc sp. TaxID=1180 RepID=UPI002FF78201